MSEEQVLDNSSQVEPQVEKEARIFGWVPKEEFRGSDEDWVDADTFVKRGKEINPILRKNNETLLKKLDEKSKEIDSIKESVEDIDDRIDAIKEEQREAKQEAKQPETKPTTTTDIPNDPELQSWVERNPWFGQDGNQEMTDMTNGLGASIRRQFPNLVGRAFLDKLDERIAEYFPAKVGGNKARGSAVDSTGNVRGGATGGKKTYDSLPADAKAACDKFVKQGLFKSRQEYVDLYDWS